MAEIPIPTLEDLPQLGVTHIRVWCGGWPGACTHQGTVPVASIDLRQTIVEFAAKLRCEVCGRVGGQAMPSWPVSAGPARAHTMHYPLTTYSRPRQE